MYSSRKITINVSDIETAVSYIEKNYFKDLINFKYKLKNTKNVLNNICKNIKKNRKYFLDQFHSLTAKK